MTSSHELFRSVVDHIVLVEKELSEPKPDINKVWALLLTAACATQELKNRYNGQLPPMEDERDKKWNVRELL